MSEAAVPVKRTQGERVALSQRRMTQAAIRLLTEQGIAGATLAAIGERAGYSRGLATQRFGSKAGLLAYVHDTLAAEWIGRMRATVGEAVGIEAMERVITALTGFIAEAPEEIRALYLLRYVSIDPTAEYRANVAKVHRAQRRDVQQWIEAGQTKGDVAGHLDAELVAEVFCATVDGIVYRWLVNPGIPVRDMHSHLRLELARTLRGEHGACERMPAARAEKRKKQ